MRLRNSAIVPGAMVALGAAAAPAMAQAARIADRDGLYHHGHGMMWDGGHWGGFGMILGPIFLILVIVGIVVGVIWLLRRFGMVGPGGSHGAHDRALALLKERYARGEIDSEEFAERRKLLSE